MELASWSRLVKTYLEVVFDLQKQTVIVFHTREVVSRVVEDYSPEESQGVG